MIYVNFSLLTEWSIFGTLPDYIVHADTVNCFKSRLDTIRIWYITSKPKSAEPEAEVKLYSKYYTNTLYEWKNDLTRVRLLLPETR